MPNSKRGYGTELFSKYLVRMIMEKEIRTVDDAIVLLKEYNKWRLGADIEMPHPKSITKAIEKIIEDYETRC